MKRTLSVVSQRGFGLRVNPERLVREESLQELSARSTEGLIERLSKFERNLKESLDCIRCGIRNKSKKKSCVVSGHSFIS